MNVRRLTFLGVAAAVLLFAHCRQAEAVKEIDGDTLSERLRYESERSVPPHLSIAVREAENAGSAAVPELLQAVRSKDAASFLALVALARLDRNTYDALPLASKREILIAALGRHSTFNAWGHPWLGSTESSDLLIGLGPAALPGLQSLFADNRFAPLIGPATLRSSIDARLRVKDIAAHLAARIMGVQLAFDDDPALRDRAIDQLSRRISAKRPAPANPDSSPGRNSAL
ncbi:MAG: hypothetical protein NXI24_20270 [bacterium]|nr:hypothetical protein [bacterium]